MPPKRGQNGRFLPRAGDGGGNAEGPQIGGRRRRPQADKESDYAPQPRRRQTPRQEKESNETRAMQQFITEMQRREKAPAEGKKQEKKVQYGKAPKPPRTRVPPIAQRRKKVPPDHSDSEDSFAAPIRGQGKHFGANRGNAPMKSPGMRGAGDAVEPSPLAVQDGSAAGNVLNPVPRPYDGALQMPQRLMVDDITIIHQ